jgi:hypothetical protein
MLIMVGVLAVIWSLWICTNDKVFNNKYLQYRYALFMVTSLADGEQRPIYGDMYTIVEYGEGYFSLYG